MNLTKFWKSFGVKFALTSSTIVRHIETECNETFSMKYCISDSQLSFLKSPRAKIYSLASRTKCKLLLPQFFSGLAQLLDNFLLAHSLKRRRFPGYAFTKLLPQSFSLFYVFVFHKLLPHFYGFSTAFQQQNTMKLVSCQGHMYRNFNLREKDTK